MAHPIMIQGTMSGAGKSLLTAALCRIFKQDGFSVAPFKSQNMALNSAVTKEELEIGRAQAMQAEACGIEASVLMNPVLLKPNGDTRSQVIVKGEVYANMNAVDYYAFKKNLIPVVKETYQELSSLYDIVVIEGAGSPAEINLKENDFANMGMADIADAPVLLVGDIDRGGVFAQFVGTVELLEKEERERIKGFVINKFRGDKSILDPGIKMLEEKTGIEVFGTLPYLKINLDDEDSLSLNKKNGDASGKVNVAVVRLPRISNFTDFSNLEQRDDVYLHYVSSSQELKDCDFLILPGTKNTLGDLLWLKNTGLEKGIKDFAKSGRPLLGICGGYQILGKELLDSSGEGDCISAEGLNLLPVSTRIGESKIRKNVSFILEQCGGFFSCLSGMPISGYEIHMGQTKVLPCESLKDKCHDFTGASGCQYGNVYGTYVHGFFDEEGVAQKVVQALAKEKGIACTKGKNDSWKKTKEKQFDYLAEQLRQHLDMDKIYHVLGYDIRGERPNGNF